MAETTKAVRITEKAHKLASVESASRGESLGEFLSRLIEEKIDPSVRKLVAKGESQQASN